MLRLLSLPQEVQDLVNKGKVSYGQARTLLALEKEDQMVELAKRIVSEGLSVRELEQFTRKKDNKKGATSPAKKKDPYIEDVKDTLQSKYGTKVEIKDKKIIIHYNNTKDLNRILELMDAIEE